MSSVGLRRSDYDLRRRIDTQPAGALRTATVLLASDDGRDREAAGPRKRIDSGSAIIYGASTDNKTQDPAMQVARSVGP